jgi:hypothetical protein
MWELCEPFRRYWERLPGGPTYDMTKVAEQFTATGVCAHTEHRVVAGGPLDAFEGSPAEPE